MFSFLVVLRFSLFFRLGGYFSVVFCSSLVISINGFEWSCWRVQFAFRRWGLIVGHDYYNAS